MAIEQYLEERWNVFRERYRHKDQASEGPQRQVPRHQGQGDLQDHHRKETPGK